MSKQIHLQEVHYVGFFIGSFWILVKKPNSHYSYCFQIGVVISKQTSPMLIQARVLLHAGTQNHIDQIYLFCTFIQ